MKKVLLSILTTGLNSAAFAQAAAQETNSFWSDPFNHPMTPFYAVLALIVVVVALISFVAFSLARVLNTLSESVEKERAQRMGIEYKPRPSWWDKFSQAANNSVPLEEEAAIELDHNYDGIRELDNHLPPWWKYLFYFTIVWSVFYVIAYHFTNSLPLPKDEYKNEVAEAEKVKQSFLATQPKVQIDENAITYSSDATIIAKGKELFAANCVGCHRADGGGGIGPNLTDAYWLHGGEIKNIYLTVKEGVPGTSMISWAASMKPDEIRDVAFFVMSLQGSNPPGAKPAQGVLAAPASPATQSDSVKTQASL